MQTIVFSLLLASVHSLLVSTLSSKRNLNINNVIKPYNFNYRYVKSTAVYMSTDLNNVKDLVLTEKNSLSRSELNEYILQLEKLNPTEDPALSPLLNGVWEVISSGKLFTHDNNSYYVLISIVIISNPLSFPFYFTYSVFYIIDYNNFRSLFTWFHWCPDHQVITRS